MKNESKEKTKNLIEQKNETLAKTKEDASKLLKETLESFRSTPLGEDASQFATSPYSNTAEQYKYEWKNKLSFYLETPLPVSMPHPDGSTCFFCYILFYILSLTWHRLFLQILINSSIK